MKQQSFWKKPGPSHGGAQAKGRRKTARPLATKRSLHGIWKSEQAKGPWALDKHRAKIAAKIEEAAERFDIKLRGHQILWNHIHILFQGRRRKDIRAFLRFVSGQIAMLVTGAAKTRAVGRFWSALVFTRIVEWGRDYFNMKAYLIKNNLQARGFDRRFVDEWFREAFG